MNTINNSRKGLATEELRKAVGTWVFADWVVGVLASPEQLV